MWHLVRLNNKKDKEAAEKVLSTSNLLFLPLPMLVEQYQPQPAIVHLINQFGENSYLIEDGDTSNGLHPFLNEHKDFFQKVRCRTGKAGHVRLTQEELDQFILTLQVPESYPVICVESLPDNDSLKDLRIPYGPLQGLKGKFLNTRTPSMKRFFLPVLSLFHLEIRIPIKDVRRSKEERSVEISYLFDKQTPHWFLLSCLKKEYIDQVLGDTINTWYGKETADPIRTTLTHAETMQTAKTIRYLFQAIYRRPSENGYDEINLMPRYFFFRTTLYDLETFRSSGFDSHIYIMRNNNGSPIQIPEAQMRIFARFLQERSEATEVLFQDYQKGDEVKVVMGIEANNEIEGTVEVVTQNHYILISNNGFKINVRKRRKK